MRSLLAVLLVMGFILRPKCLADDEPEAALKKIILAGEHKDTATRLAAADRLARPAYSAEALAAAAGLAASSRLDPVGAASVFFLENIARQKWSDAIDEYQQILYDEGDNLVPAGAAGAADPSARSIQVRRLCHLRIAAAPPSSRLLYQKRVDVLAEKWFREGKESHAVEPLYRLVNELFCSRFGDRALELLGDLAFERGEFAEALQWWRLLALLPSEAGAVTPAILLFPDPGVDPARIRAKQIIAIAFKGDAGRAAHELKTFASLHPHARGTLAGRQGNYATLVDEVLRNAAPAADEAWPTFAGSATRNRVAQEPSPRMWAEGPTWRLSLSDFTQIASQPPQAGPFARHGRPAIHPIITGDKVLISDAASVTGFDLLSGRLLFRYDLKTAGLVKALPKPSATTGLHFTLSASGDRVFARLGGQGPGQKQQPGSDGSFLVCLQIPSGDEKGKAGIREIWHAGPRGDAVFEGAPLVHEGAVTIALSEASAGRVKTSLACYDAAAGAVRWLQEVCDTPAAAGASAFRQHLLTLAGSQVVYCSHSGAIVAVDRLTGKRLWGVRYAGRAPDLPGRAPAPPRDLAPCLFSNNRLFVAPLDADRIFCLDAWTGELLWDRDGIEVVDLLGEVQGRLIFTTPKGLRALDAATAIDQGGWVQPGVGKLPPLGRGLLAGHGIFWPVHTRESPMRLLDQKDGAQILVPAELRQIIAGNMAFGNSCLVVAGADELAAYVPPERFLQKFQADVEEPGASGLAYYRLATAEAGAGLSSRALEDFARAAQAPVSTRWKGRPVRDLALSGCHELLLHLARKSKAQPLQAAGFLHKAAGEEFPRSLRLQACMNLVDLWLEAQQPERALAVLQAVLRDQNLRQGTMLADDGLPAQASLVALRRIKDLIDKHGPAVFASFDQQAQQLFARAKGDARALKRLVAEFPNATIVPAALRELAALESKAGHAGAAAEAYRTLLLLENPKSDPVPLWTGLARAYERQGCWEAARAAWVSLAEKYGGRALHDRTVRDVVADQLRKTEYQAAAEGADALSVPLVLSWEAPAGRLLVPIRNTLFPRKADIVFFVSADELSCRQLATGIPRWYRKLAFAPSWLGLHADIVLVGGAETVEARRLEDGELLWTFAFSDKEQGTSYHQRISSVHMTETHLFFREDERRLIALDIGSGRVAWSRWAPGALLRPVGGGRFHLHFLAGARCVLIQTSDGRRLGLDGHTGRLLHERQTAGGPWPQAPFALVERDTRLCLVEDGRVILLDSATGENIWTHTPPRPTSLSGEPLQVIGNAHVLVVQVPRNQGYELEYLDSKTGTPLKTVEPRPVSLNSFDLHAAALDDGCVYVAADNLLSCWSLADGARQWQAPLSPKSGHWRAVRTADALAVYPAEDRQPPWLWLPLGNVVLAVPSVADRESRLQPLALSLHDLKTGRAVQRFDLSAAAARLDVQLSRGRLVIGAAGSARGYVAATRARQQ